MLLIGGVLAIWPVVAFVLLLARRVLFRDARDGLEVRQRFYRSLRWTMVLGGVLAALVILTSTLPLSPALADLVDRSAMLCVLLIALPGLQLRSLILALAGGRERAGLASRLAARASLLVPLVLAGAAAIGLAGYLNLAWTIIEHFLWLVLIGGLLLLALGILGRPAPEPAPADRRALPRHQLFLDPQLPRPGLPAAAAPAGAGRRLGRCCASTAGTARRPASASCWRSAARRC